MNLLKAIVYYNENLITNNIGRSNDVIHRTKLVIDTSNKSYEFT